MTDLFWPPVQQTIEPAPQPEPASPRRAWRTTAAAAGLSALVFGGIGVGVGVSLDGNHTASTSLPTSALPAGSLSVNPTSYAGIAAKVLP